jgi:hypothetical protein
MRSPLHWAVVALILTPTFAAAQDVKYTIKTTTDAPPKELQEPLRKLLRDGGIQLRSPKGDPIAEFWFCKEVASEATPEQLKAGVTYRNVPQTTFVGAVRVDKSWTDYRKQKIKAGVYTLRIAYQPQDGDHMGTAPYTEFVLLVSADSDKTPDTLEPKKLHEMSTSSIGTTHPGVFLLFPNPTAGAQPQLLARPNNHVILSTREGVTANGKSTGAFLGIGLAVVGHSE